MSGWTLFYYGVAGGVGVLVGAIGMLWYVSFRSDRDDRVTMSHGRLYDLTKTNLHG